VYAVTKNGEKKFWQLIGAMWAHADANGFNLRIDYLPLNDAEIVVRVASLYRIESRAMARLLARHSELRFQVAEC
jgi:hypothetical protein